VFSPSLQVKFRFVNLKLKIREFPIHEFDSNSLYEMNSIVNRKSRFLSESVKSELIRAKFEKIQFGIFPLTVNGKGNVKRTPIKSQ